MIIVLSTLTFNWWLGHCWTYGPTVVSRESSWLDTDWYWLDFFLNYTVAKAPEERPEVLLYRDYQRLNRAGLESFTFSCPQGGTLLYQIRSSSWGSSVNQIANTVAASPFGLIQLYLSLCEEQLLKGLHGAAYVCVFFAIFIVGVVGGLFIFGLLCHFADCLGRASVDCQELVTVCGWSVAGFAWFRYVFFLLSVLHRCRLLRLLALLKQNGSHIPFDPPFDLTTQLDFCSDYSELELHRVQFFDFQSVVYMCCVHVLVPDYGLYYPISIATPFMYLGRLMYLGLVRADAYLDSLG